MELKFEKIPCPCLRPVLQEVRNVEQTQELRLSEGMPDVGRVLCAWGQPMLRSKEWRSDGMTATGGVMAWVLYAPEEGGEAQCVDIWIPFQAKWDFPATDREGIICQVPLVRSVDARTVSARKLMIRVNVGIWAQALEPCEVQICIPADLPEGVELLRHTYPVKLAREAGEKTFLLDEELTLAGSCPPMERLLRFELLPQLSDSRVMAGKVVFRGSGGLHVLYRGEDGDLHTWDTEIPFSQFGELQEELGQDSEARIALAVNSLELDKMEDGTLRLKCGMVAQYVVEDRVLLELAEDAYSPQREVTPVFQQIHIPAVLDGRMEQMSAEVVLEGDCRRVLDLSFWPDHPNISRMTDQVRICQPGIFQLLYEDPSGNLQCALRRWEQTWTMEAAEDSVVSSVMNQNGQPTAQLSGGNVTMRGSVALWGQTGTTRAQQMLSGMELGDLKTPDANRPSLILRRSEGEQLWDLAKHCGTTVRAICQANGLTEEPDPGRMLLIPVP